MTDPVTKLVWNPADAPGSLKWGDGRREALNTCPTRILNPGLVQLWPGRALKRLLVTWWNWRCRVESFPTSNLGLCRGVPQVKGTDVCVVGAFICWRGGLHWCPLIGTLKDLAVIQWCPGMIRFEFVMVDHFGFCCLALLDTVDQVVQSAHNKVGALTRRQELLDLVFQSLGARYQVPHCISYLVVDLVDVFVLPFVTLSRPPQSFSCQLVRKFQSLSELHGIVWRGIDSVVVGWHTSYYVDWVCDFLSIEYHVGLESCGAVFGYSVSA